MKRIVIIGLIAAVLVGCSSGPTDGGGGKPSKPAAPVADLVTADSPPYAKLAAIDATSPNPSASAIANFKNLFESLTKKCWKDSASRIADYIVKGQELLKEKGRDMSLLEITRAVDSSLPEGVQVGSCSDIVSAFVVLVK